MSNLDAFRDELENLQMHELRSVAKNKYDITVPRESTKADIIREVMRLVNQGAAVAAFGTIPPGYARIKLHQTGERSDADVIVSVQGYTSFVPMNKEVDVPIKVLEALKLAEETNYSANPAYKPTADHDGDNVKKITQYSYPFSVLGINPGPDPRPSSWQTAREELVAKKRQFMKVHGYWPKNIQVMAKHGFTTNQVEEDAEE